MRISKIIILIILCLGYVKYSLAKELQERSLGSKDANHVIIEYASLSCVHCANFHKNDFPEIKEKLIDTGKVRFIFRDFPLDLPAMIGSMVSQCQDNNKYFIVLNTLFKNQKKWVTSPDIKLAIADVLKEYGFTKESVENCVVENDTNTVRWKNILNLRLKAQEMGVDSTPTFFVNNTQITGSLDVKKIKDLID